MADGEKTVIFTDRPAAGQTDAIDQELRATTEKKSKEKNPVGSERSVLYTSSRSSHEITMAMADGRVFS